MRSPGEWEQMRIVTSETIPIHSSEDIVVVRQAVRRKAVAMGFGLVDQTKVVTATSELARNTVDHGGGGTARIEIVETSIHSGLRIVFEDAGPGIVDTEVALRDGFTTGKGLGLGLGGARRLSHEFELDSKPGAGTRVAIVRWR
jgi:serine/threonine-protein kinase RsbT